MEPAAPAIAAVLPALDEAETIAAVVASLRRQPLLDRVVVVDNGSRDATGALALRAGAEVVREERRGYGRACLAGVRAAAGAEVIVLLDADGADDPADLDRVLAPLLAGEADLVVGSRALGNREHGAMTLPQRAGNRVATLMIGLLLRRRVSDLGPFRAIRRRHLLGLEMAEPSYGWSAEMVVKALRSGLRYREVAVGYRRRAGGESKVSGSPRAALAAGWCILAAIARGARWRPGARA